MKTALITGAARGIGLATTDILRSQGWHVVMVDRDAEELMARASERQAVTAAVYDISDPDQVDAMVATTLAARGQIDALVNNAGVADFGPIEHTSFARWRRVMETNLDGAFLCTQAATPTQGQSRRGGQYRLNLWVAGLDPAGGLWNVKSSNHSYDPTICSRAGRIWYSGQFCGARSGAHQTGHGRTHPRHHRRLSRCYSAGSLWQRSRNRAGHRLSVLRSSQLCDRAKYLGRWRV